MHDQWSSHVWYDSAESTAGDVSLADPDGGRSFGIDEEVPKPFLSEYLPTQAEIRRACREIQQGWTEAERRRRRGYRRAHTQPHALRAVRTAFAN